MTQFIFSYVSCVIPDKTTNMEGETWENALKVLASGIIKNLMITVACLLNISYPYI